MLRTTLTDKNKIRVYDIVINVEGEAWEKLEGVMTWKVRRLNSVRSTLTMIVMEGT
jgi:DNA-binding Lrp family transcriptional regulator